MNLIQDESANTESSAVIQWQSPEETGGREISIYTVTVSGVPGHEILSESVSVDYTEWYLHSHHHRTGLQQRSKCYCHQLLWTCQ